MTLAEALREICDKQIPKEINGISTKYVVTEFEDCGIGAVKLSIMPTNIFSVDIGLTSNYLKRDYMTFTFDKGYRNNGYDLLEKDVKEMLCWYIRNIMKWTDGKVVREMTYEEWVKSERGDSE